MGHLNMEPIISNDRDRRAWEWIVAQVGEDRALGVDLAGDRKPYPSNVAKALGLTIPETVKLPPSDVARERLAGLKAILKGKA